MKRRQFLAISTGSLIITATSATIGTAAADNLDHVDYTRDAYEQALASGEPFLLDFYASW